MTMTAPLLTEDEARELLRDVERPFVAGHLHAWQQWERLRAVCTGAEAADLLLPLSATTRANFLNNHCVAHVVGELGPLLHPLKVKVVDVHGFLCILVMEDDRAALVRFKFLGPDLLPRNVATEQQRSVDRQEWDPDLLTGLDLPGTVRPTWVFCGYRLTEDETAVATIHLLCKQNGSLEWQYIIHGDGGTGEVVVDFPLPGSPPRASRVVSKRKRASKAPAVGGDEGTS